MPDWPGSSPASPGGGRLTVSLHQAGPIPLAAEFACEPGELLALVGPSGSGKTTLLRAIAGLYRPAEGRIDCGGETWLDTSPGIVRRPQARRVGVVFQDYALFPHLNARDNVKVALGHLEPGRRSACADEWLGRMRLEGLAGRYPSQLSGGQRQRVALARALAREPRALLLDEPFSAVDQVTRRRLQRELALLREQIHIPILLVTHDLDEAVALADRICVLHGGRTLQTDVPERLFRHPASAEVARLLDRHNIFEGRVVEAGGQRRLQWGPWLLQVGNGLEDFAINQRVAWYLPDSDVVLHRRDRPSRGDRENPVTGHVGEMVVLGGVTSLTLVFDHGPETLRFDIATHAARRNGLARGERVRVSLLAGGIHLLPRNPNE
ncbi:ABC transporter ATP-binding protein [Halomonas chromatireducens]|uniref:Sulfate/thiosulfate import ATP-binding protein CysA n=1 Tax=Halomonas chromatireducens TaxID=507626 RepID=A0A0X8HEX4_9GAMM|nr:ABC transporter ATP-binding protein [Halomonas chromatireducens]AMD01376.1 Sulfate/thiosulfate import ATP-binding protein CysA [Halomonas chromatireducens]